MNDNYIDVTAQEKELQKLSKKAVEGTEDYSDRINELKSEIAKGHNYQFVGRVGLFTPVVSGGGDLLRKTDTGYSYAAGTKGYRWLDATIAKDTNAEIDISYYRKMLDDAIHTIKQARVTQVGLCDSYTEADADRDVTDFLPY